VIKKLAVTILPGFISISLGDDNRTSRPLLLLSAASTGLKNISPREKQKKNPGDLFHDKIPN